MQDNDESSKLTISGFIEFNVTADSKEATLIKDALDRACFKYRIISVLKKPNNIMLMNILINDQLVSWRKKDDDIINDLLRIASVNLGTLFFGTEHNHVYRICHERGEWVTYMGREQF